MELEGLYEADANQCEGRVVWIQGAVGAQIMWTGIEWVVASRGRYFYASGPHLNNTSSAASDSDPVSFDPIRFNGTWSEVINSTGAQPEGVDRVPAPNLVLGCLATPDEFEMRFEPWELWSFGFNFYGELARADNVLTMARNPEPQRVTSRLHNPLLLCAEHLQGRELPSRARSESVGACSCSSFISALKLELAPCPKFTPGMRADSELSAWTLWLLVATTGTATPL
eukprot:1494390-Rhodomonas_salina.2